jgi:hyperosmotically inducible protein
MKRIQRVLAVSSSLALLLALGACGERTATDTATVGSSSSSSTTTAPSNDTSVLGAGKSTGAADDAQIVTKINTGLAADKDLSVFKIDVDSKSGMVTLKGTVPNDQAKSRAAEIAKATKDVKSVDNQLTVSAS